VTFNTHEKSLANACHGSACATHTTAHTNTSATTEARATHTLTPRCDIYEREGVVHAVVEMPGVAEDAVDVTIERDVLTVRGRFDSPAPEGFRALWREFGGGTYERSFELSSDVDAAGIQAAVKNGLLTLRVPKTRPVQRKIPIAAT